MPLLVFVTFVPEANDLVHTSPSYLAGATGALRGRMPHQGCCIISFSVPVPTPKIAILISAYQKCSYVVTEIACVWYLDWYMSLRHLPYLNAQHEGINRVIAVPKEFNLDSFDIIMIDLPPCQWVACPLPVPLVLHVLKPWGLQSKHWVWTVMGWAGIL